MEVKRYSISWDCPRCYCKNAAVTPHENAVGGFVYWSDVEPLLQPRPALTDEQVLKLAGEFDSIVRTSRASDKRFDAMRREMLCSLRAVLAEVLG